MPWAKLIDIEIRGETDKKALIICLLVGLSSFFIFHSAAYAGDESSGHDSHHKNFLGIFVGLAAEDRHENGVALGLEYERLLNPSIGLGFTAERSFGDLDAWTYVAPLERWGQVWSYSIWWSGVLSSMAMRTEPMERRCRSLT